MKFSSRLLAADYGKSLTNRITKKLEQLVSETLPSSTGWVVTRSDAVYHDYPLDPGEGGVRYWVGVPRNNHNGDPEFRPREICLFFSTFGRFGVQVKLIVDQLTEYLNSFPGVSARIEREDNPVYEEYTILVEPDINSLSDKQVLNRGKRIRPAGPEVS